MMQPRVLVIGAGVVGLFTAVELLGDGRYEVTVLDRDHPGSGSSGRSVGMVETQYPTRATVEARAFGRRAYERLAAEHGLGFVHSGYLRLGSSPDDLEAFARSIEIQREFGIEDAELLTAQQISERWPRLITDGITGGVFGAWDGHVDGYETCRTLTGIVRGLGGKVKAGAEVTAAERTGEAWRITAGGIEHVADIVVNAAGPHAGRIGELLGAPVPLLPQLHGAITVRLPAPAALPFVMDYVPGSGVDGVYFRPEGDGRLIAGLHTEEAIGASVDPDAPLRELADGVVERIAVQLMNRLRGAEELEPDRSWQGIYPMTPDHRPIVGAYPGVPGVICALGAGGSGIQLSPAIGRLAADAIRGTERPAFEIADAWSPSRAAASQ